MSNDNEAFSVEKQIFETFLDRLKDDSELSDGVAETIRRLHESADLSTSSEVVDSLLELAGQGGAANAS